MTRSRRSISASKPLRTRPSRLRQPTSKQLDLMVLAGCSCLMTLLYHPVTDAMRSAPASSQASAGTIAAQVNRTSHPATPIHFSLPPEREKIKEDDEEV